MGGGLPIGQGLVKAAKTFIALEGLLAVGALMKVALQGGIHPLLPIEGLDHRIFLQFAFRRHDFHLRFTFLNARIWGLGLYTLIFPNFFSNFPWRSASGSSPY